MKKFVFGIFVFVFAVPCLGQDYSQRVNLRTGTIGAALPFSGVETLLTDVYRPYVEVGYGWALRQREHHSFWFDVNLGYFNHRFIQQALPLMASLQYNYHFNQKISAFSSLNAGYIHAFPHEGRFILNDQGDYEKKKSLGRPQIGFGLSLGGDYQLDDRFSVQLSYTVLMQAPFVNTYVPLLPYGILQIGMHFLL
ncbi:MAG: hypothetical protein JJU02_05750 [Cryomorphaceae bacterium]|nr:hypothetical protein [Cryomorphaceae bacterium]